jgi:hypothetical protein
MSRAAWAGSPGYSDPNERISRTPAALVALSRARVSSQIQIQATSRCCRARRCELHSLAAGAASPPLCAHRDTVDESVERIRDGPRLHKQLSESSKTCKRTAIRNVWPARCYGS